VDVPRIDVSTGPRGVVNLPRFSATWRGPSKRASFSGSAGTPWTTVKCAGSWAFSAISWMQVAIVNSCRSTDIHSGSASSGWGGTSNEGAPPAASCQTKIAPLCSTTGQARMRALAGIFFA